MADFEDLSTLLKGFIKSGPAGCGCAVAKDGDALYEGYFGYADKEEGIPITENTVYRLYSMTKVVICTAALMLFERGKFLLNEPIYNYIPEFKDTHIFVTEPNGNIHVEKTKNPMLIKHAFTMSVGLPYPNFVDSATAREMTKVKEELTKEYGRYDIVTEAKAVANVPVAFEPGTHWLYGYGHDIVAALIQVISGKTVGEFLQDEIFDPLNMDDTGYRFKNDIEDRMAAYYEKSEDGSLTKAEAFLDFHHQPDAIYESGGAGLYSTVKDYLKFSQMLANGGSYNNTRIIGRKTIDLMRTNQLHEIQLRDFQNPSLAGYGYGLGVRTLMSISDSLSNSSIGEFGWSGMLGTYVSIDPAEGLSLVYMQQMIPKMEEFQHLRIKAVANGCI